MSLYEEQLEAKIKRQKSEITRLLKENAELKSDRAAGQEEAWELAKKIIYDTYHDGYNLNELKEIFGYRSPQNIFENNKYSEAAAKVAEWEKAKEEVCVGDVVECEGSYGVVVGVGECYIKGFTSDWTSFQWMKRSCTKTGRHIDVNAWLAQIGGDCNG